MNVNSYEVIEINIESIIQLIYKRQREYIMKWINYSTKKEKRKMQITKKNCISLEDKKQSIYI